MLDKAEIARRQLGAALAFFIENLDPVVVHVLAGGGGEVAQHLPKKVGKPSFRDSLDMTDREFKSVRNRYWNAFKHATTQGGLDRQDEEDLAAFDDEKNEHILITGWLDYQKGGFSLPIEAQIFLSWYCARYPEKVKPSTFRDGSIKVFGDTLRDVDRAEAKRRLAVVVAEWRTNRDVLADPNTDSRALVANL
jgi:hypothetical protein